MTRRISSGGKSRSFTGYLIGLAAWLLGIQSGVLIIKASEVSMSWYLARAEMAATATAIPGEPPGPGERPT